MFLIMLIYICYQLSNEILISYILGLGITLDDLLASLGITLRYYNYIQLWYLTTSVYFHSHYFRSLAILSDILSGDRSGGRGVGRGRR